jgi:uncharacterized repeat protein (TIGR02543 family)
VPNQDVTRTGYQFTGWYLSPELTQWIFGTNKMPARNIVLMAQWTFIPVPVVVTPPGTPGTPGGPGAPTFTEAVIAGLAIADTQTPQDPGTTINPDRTPRGPGEGGNWSLLSLILSCIAILSAIFVLARGRKTARRERLEYNDRQEYYAEFGISYEDQAEERSRKLRRFSLVLSILAGILTPIVWLYLDDLTQPMVFINRWTIVVACFFIVNAVFHIVHRRETRKEDEEEESQGATA